MNMMMKMRIKNEYDDENDDNERDMNEYDDEKNDVENEIQKRH